MANKKLTFPLLSRDEAKQLGYVRYQGPPCVHGHNGERFTGGTSCVECARIKRREYVERQRLLHPKRPRPLSAREKAKQLGMRQYHGRPCPYGHGDIRLTWNTHCIECVRIHKKQNYERFKSRHPLFAIWKGMLTRCYSTKHKGYRNYGGRGIKVCDRWHQSFDAFAEDVGPRPSPLHTIDRINTQGHYEPGNVRWATWPEQQRNRGNLKLTLEDARMIRTLRKQGEKVMTLMERFNVSRKLISEICRNRRWKE